MCVGKRITSTDEKEYIKCVVSYQGLNKQVGI